MGQATSRAVRSARPGQSLLVDGGEVVPAEVGGFVDGPAVSVGIEPGDRLGDPLSERDRRPVAGTTPRSLLLSNTVL